MRIWNLANSITGIRLVFFALCIYSLISHNPFAAGIFFCIAWGLDAIDGTIARRMNETTIFGSQLDKTVDRIIFAGTILVLLWYSYIPPYALFLLTKDIGLLPAFTAKKKGKPFPSAGVGGKIISVLQGVGILWLLAGWPGSILVVSIGAVSGALVAVVYLRRL